RAACKVLLLGTTLTIVTGFRRLSSASFIFSFEMLMAKVDSNEPSDTKTRKYSPPLRWKTTLVCPFPSLRELAGSTLTIAEVWFSRLQKTSFERVGRVTT